MGSPERLRPVIDRDFFHAYMSIFNEDLFLMAMASWIYANIYLRAQRNLVSTEICE
jgi:hypothetical protein